MSASYTKRVEGDAVVFDVTPAPAPRWWGMLIFGIIMLLIAIRSENVPTTMFVLFGVIGVWAAFRDPRPKDHKGRSTFRVSPDGVKTNTNFFQTADIDRMAAENVYAGKGTTSGGTFGAVSAGRLKKMTTVGYFLQIVHRGQPYCIATGMDEQTVQRLGKDVTEILESRTSGALR